VHTIKVLAAGFALLAICLVAGRSFAGSSTGLVLGAKAFVPPWLAGAAINMWIGVSKAGYSVADEAPVFLMVFGIPAAVALFIIWRSTGATG
jgi:hypothetical protein